MQNLFFPKNRQDVPFVVLFHSSFLLIFLVACCENKMEKTKKKDLIYENHEVKNDHPKSHTHRSQR